MNRDPASELRSGAAQIVVGVLATLLMTGAVVWSVWESWQNTVAQSRRATAQIATTIASQADEMLGRGVAVAEDLRARVMADPALLVPGNAGLAELIARVGRAAPPGIGISLANADGLLVGASRNADLRSGSVSIAQQPSFRTHRDAPAGDAAVRISPPFMLSTRPVRAFVLSIAVRDASGALLGVSAVSVPAERVFLHLDSIRRGVASHMALVHRDGYVLTITPESAEALPVRPVSAWAPALDGKVGTSDSASPFSYRRAIVSHEQLVDFPVYAVVGRDIAEVFSAWRGERWERLITYGVMIAAAIGLNLWLLLAVRGRLRAEAALRESSEGRFHEFASIASDWFWETDAEHRFTFVSAGVSSAGVPPDSFIGKKRSERAQELPGPVSPRLLELERLMEERRTIRGYVFDGAQANGERRWYEVSAKPHVNDAGVFRGYRGVARDVTSLHEAQDRIAASEARLVDSINSMPIGYALWNARDRLVAWNRRYLELWPTAADLLQPGITFAAFMEKALRQACPGISAAEFQERLAERIDRHASCGPSWLRELPDGRVIEFTEVRTSDGGIVSLYDDVTERQSALKRLADSDARFRDGIESMSQGFVLWGGDQKLIAWNTRAAALLTHAAGLFVPGMDRANFLTEAARRLFPDKDDAEIRAMASQRIGSQQDGRPFEITTREGRFVVAMSHPTSDGGIVVTYNDVTEQRAFEARLRGTEARFRDGIESMADGFSLWDAEDRLVAWNARYALIAPIEGEVLRPGIPFLDCIAHLERRLAELDPPWNWRAHIARRRDRRALLGQSIEVTNIHGTMIELIEQPTSEGGVVSIYRDVTDARHAAMRLAESEARFHDFADAASDWFWETDPDHRFTFLSTGLRTIGSEPGRVIGQTRAEYFRLMGLEPDPALDELQAILDRRDVIRGLCYASTLNEAGIRTTLEIHGKPVFDAAGGFLGYRGVGRDVTLRNQQQAELARALRAEREVNAQQRRFVSIAGHEFRTPLAVIDGATQRLMTKLGGNDDDDARKRLDRIRGAVSRMTELIDRTLSSARLDEGRIDIDAQRFDLGAMLSEVVERQRQISGTFDIRFEPAAGDLWIEGDAKLLEQVFSNLLSNAVKYSGSARRIEIGATTTATAVELTVTDHGLGIHADEIPQLFTRFFRARTAMGIPGTGIGLHLVRELVQMHGGEVDVRSEIGAGTTFTVTLPRRQRVAPAADAAQ